MKKFYLYNQRVCTRLSLFGSDLENLLLKNGWQPTVAEEADYLFINSCAFLKIAEDRAINTVKQFEADKRSQQTLVVFGCLPYINFQRLKNNFSGEIIVARELAEFVKLFGLKNYPEEISHTLNRQLNWRSKFSRLVNRLFIGDAYLSYLNGARAFYLKIGQGCLGQCSYCSEKNARGRLRSRKISEVVGQFKSGLAQGYRIFSFNADDVGVYGWDNQENIADLLSEVINLPEDFKLMLTEFNPQGLVRFREKLLPLISSSKIAHITIPLQSGSDKILKLMRRPYQISELMEILQQIRAANKNLALNTHIIVGFPGETEADFNQTAKLLQTKIFDKVKIFKYSDQPGTESYLLPDKVGPREIDRRYQKLRHLVLRQQLERLQLRNLLLNVSLRY